MKKPHNAHELAVQEGIEIDSSMYHDRIDEIQNGLT